MAPEYKISIKALSALAPRISMLRISVITPCFNGAAFIESAILGVLVQQYSNFEHIVIDGGSTDETLPILAKYDHIRWISAKDRGMYDAFNKGIGMATGDIIASCNTDDIYLPGSFHFADRFFSAHPEIDYIYGDYREADETGVSFRVRRDPPFAPFVFRWLSHDFVPCPASFWRRRVHDQGLMLNAGYRYAADYEFHCELLRRGYRFRHVPMIFCHFRRHSSALTTSGAAEMRREMREIQRRQAHVMGRLPDLPYGIARRILGLIARGIRTVQKLVTGAYIEHFRS